MKIYSKKTYKHIWLQIKYYFITSNSDRMFRSKLVFLLIATTNALIVEHSNTAPLATGPIAAYYPGFSVEWSDIRRTFLVDSTANYTVDQNAEVSQLNQDTIQVI